MQVKKGRVSAALFTKRKWHDKMEIIMHEV